jgi:hypothetical protein
MKLKKSSAQNAACQYFSAADNLKILLILIITCTIHAIALYWETRMKFSSVILIILSLFVATDVYALSDEALSILQGFKNKYNKEQNNNSDFKAGEARIVEKTQEPTLDVTEIKQEKKYVPGLAFSKALSRYRTARKTGVLQQNSVPEISVNTSERASKKLKRYNINFVQQNDKEIPKVKFEDKSDSGFSTGKEISRQKLKTEESSTSLINKADTVLKKTNKKHIDSAINKKKNKEPVIPNLPAHTAGSNKKSDEEAVIDGIVTPEDDEEFNQFIRRYDFKMPDNYRIIVR